MREGKLGKTTIYHLELDTSPALDTVVDTTVVVGGLKNALTGLEKQLAKTFGSADTKIDIFSKSTSKALKVLRADVQDMKAAFSLVAEPIGRVLIPILDVAVQKVTDVAQCVGLVLSALMGIDTATKKVKAATKAEEELKKASVSAASAAKRSLAGFDQINRLNSGGGGSGGSSLKSAEPAKLLPEKVTDTLSPQLQGIVDKILAMLEPVKRIDLTPLKTSLEVLATRLSGLGNIISESFQWVWFEVLVPLGKWFIEQAAPASVEVLTAAFQALNEALQPVLQGIGSLKPYLEPVVKFMGETVLMILGTLQAKFEKLAQVFSGKGQEIQEVFQAVGQALTVLWEFMRPVLELMRSLWVGAIDTIGSTVSSIVSAIITVLSGLIIFISGVLTGDWQMVWDGLGKIFRGFVNGVIGGINGMIRGVVNGINAIIRALNQVRFTLPDWDVLGRLAGKSYGISLRTVSMPQIPYLAKGAVLPANRPFLAMVGDQRHGTNVEAPLATIQEAVALVMDDMIASNMAGQEMIVGVLRQLLEAVMGIRVGDEVIGRAVQRYNRKMAVVKGGYV